MIKNNHKQLHKSEFTFLMWAEFFPMSKSAVLCKITKGVWLTVLFLIGNKNG